MSLDTANLIARVNFFSVVKSYLISSVAKKHSNTE